MKALLSPETSAELSRGQAFGVIAKANEKPAIAGFQKIK